MATIDTYHFLAEKLLKLKDYTYYKSPKNGRFGWKYMSYYGKMAEKSKTGKYKGRIKKPKQGLFDIKIITGKRYPKLVDHRMLFEDLLTNSNREHCFSIWKGKDPLVIGKNDDEKEALVTMLLLTFEQEINWGEEIWQKWGNFNPRQKSPSKKRPRDMFMGYLLQAFDLGIDRLDEIRYWRNIGGGRTPVFMSPDGSIRRFDQHPPEFRRYFTDLEYTEGAEALMVGEIRKRFRKIAGNTKDDNPLFNNKTLKKEATK